MSSNRRRAAAKQNVTHTQFKFTSKSKKRRISYTPCKHEIDQRFQYIAFNSIIVHFPILINYKKKEFVVTYNDDKTAICDRNLQYRLLDESKTKISFDL